jgi:hypothetical protein
MKFTTLDVDNDKCKKYNCAKKWKGGWWFNNCNVAYLNGKYLGDEQRHLEKAGIFWKGFISNGKDALKGSEMKVGPAKV